MKFQIELHKETKEISCDRFAVSEGIAIFEGDRPLPHCIAAYPPGSWHGVVCIEPPVIPPAMLEAMAAAKALAEAPATEAPVVPVEAPAETPTPAE